MLCVEIHRLVQISSGRLSQIVVHYTNQIARTVYLANMAFKLMKYWKRWWQLYEVPSVLCNKYIHINALNYLCPLTGHILQFATKLRLL